MSAPSQSSVAPVKTAGFVSSQSSPPHVEEVRPSPSASLPRCMHAPLTGSQTSVVQPLPSSQSRGVPSTQPTSGSQRSSPLQGLPSSHDSSPLHCGRFTQPRSVHICSVEQSEFSWRFEQTPVARLHVSTVQRMASSHSRSSLQPPSSPVEVSELASALASTLASVRKGLPPRAQEERLLARREIKRKGAARIVQVQGSKLLRQQSSRRGFLVNWAHPVHGSSAGWKINCRRGEGRDARPGVVPTRAVRVRRGSRH